MASHLELHLLDYCSPRLVGEVLVTTKTLAEEIQ